jgi:gluconokinase
MKQHPLIFIIIGVSGSGKSTIGRHFSQALECDFQENDRRHSATNIKKMSQGTPLEDEDRREWLAAIESDIRWSIDRNLEVVMTCSALKAKYRKQLTSLGRTQLIYIKVPKDILKERLAARKNHYMSIEMLDLQISAFEPIQPIESVITVNGSGSTDEVMSDLMSKLTEQFPSLQQPWWERSID